MSAWFTTKRPLIIGHRGASADAPENTLAAFRLAQAQGADGIEFDIQLSAENRPVIIHDATLERTTNGIGHVSDYSLADLQQLDAGAGEQIPTLDQLFEACGPDFLYNIELKAQHAEQAVWDCVQRHKLAEQVLISSFDHTILQAARAIVPDSVPMALIWAADYRVESHGQFAGAAEHPHYSAVDKAYMAQMKAAQRRVNVWTVDDAAEVRRLAFLGVHGIISNRPADARAALAIA